MQLACERTVGGMAAVIGEERAKVYELCREFDIEAANFNAPGQIIVSGEKTKVDAAVAAAKDRGIKKVIALNVAGAYHSRLMEPARAAFVSIPRANSCSPERSGTAKFLATQSALPVALRRSAPLLSPLAPASWEWLSIPPPSSSTLWTIAQEV